MRLACLLAGAWTGVLVCIATIAAPAVFAMTTSPLSGRLVGRMFEQEAHASLAGAMLLFILLRFVARDAAQAGRGSLISLEMLLVLGVLFCTVAGYFAMQPMFERARAGQGGLSFGALHAISVGFFVVKGLLLGVLSWRLGGHTSRTVHFAAGTR